MNLEKSSATKAVFHFATLAEHITNNINDTAGMHISMASAQDNLVLPKNVNLFISIKDAVALRENLNRAIDYLLTSNEKHKDSILAEINLQKRMTEISKSY